MAQEFNSQNEFSVSREIFTPQPQSNGFGSGIRYRGAWDPTGLQDPLGSSYGVNDVVQYNNRSYLCIAANAISPGGAFPAILPSDTRYWRQVPSDSAMTQAGGPDDFGPLPVLGDDFASPLGTQTPPGFSSLYSRDF